MSAERKLFFTPDDYFEGLIDDIDRARREIILETYIFKLDSIGERVLAALQRAADRDVGLRLLIDGIGSYRDAATIDERMNMENCELRVFHPLPWDFSLYRRALRAGRWYSQVLYFFAAVNHRDHRKLCIVDNEIAWLGSFNITDEHFNRRSVRANDYWHDTGLRVTGSITAQLDANFARVWRRKTGSKGMRSRRFLAIDEISRRRQSRLQLLQVLEMARQRIWITNAYFNPTRQVLKTLKQKARSGVSVMLIVPRRSDIVFFPALSRSFYADLLQAGIRVYEYDDRVLHSKTMVIDEQVVVGSTNLNYRSLFHDLELDLLLADSEILAQIQRRFENDIECSMEITPRRPRRNSWLLLPLCWLARFLRYWL